MRPWNSVTCLPLLAAGVCALQGQANIGQARFVQAFYDWYVPIALRDNRSCSPTEQRLSPRTWSAR